MAKSYQLVFFDFDGVVLDSARIKTEAFPLVFEQYPEHAAVIKEYHLNHQGVSRFKKFEWIYSELLHKPLSEKESLELGNRFSQIVLDSVLKCKEIPGAIKLLNWLNAKNIKCVVASGTPFDELKTIINKRKLAHLFTEVWGSPKSKEEIIELITDKYNLPKTSTLFLGDASTDYIAARSFDVDFQAIYSEEMEDYWEQEQQQTIKNLMDIVPMYFRDET